MSVALSTRGRICRRNAAVSLATSGRICRRDFELDDILDAIAGISVVAYRAGLEVVKVAAGLTGDRHRSDLSPDEAFAAGLHQIDTDSDLD